MLIKPTDPKTHEAFTEHKTCDFHKRHPEIRDYAGCTCFGVYGLRKKKEPLAGEEDGSK
jgi:hypothetical protein